MAKRGRKPGSKNKKTKVNHTSKNIHIVVLLILSILLAVLIYGQTGYLGEKLSPVLGGIMGWIKFIIPIGVFAIAISIACNQRELMSTKLFELLVFLVCISAIFSIYQISEGVIDSTDKLSKNVEVSYKLGTKNIGGGVLGVLLAIPLTNITGVLLSPNTNSKVILRMRILPLFKA